MKIWTVLSATSVPFVLTACTTIINLGPTPVAVDAGIDSTATGPGLDAAADTSPALDGATAIDAGSDTGAEVHDAGAIDTGVDAAPACNLLTQAGCPNGNECALGANNTAQCMPTGSTTTGSDCSSANACVPGNSCMSNTPDGGGPTTCRQVCGSTADCPVYPAGNPTACFRNPLLPQVDAGTCTVPCQPVIDAGPTGCPSDQGCTYFWGRQDIDGGMLDGTTCFTPGPGTDNSPCRQMSDCASGYACVQETRVCRQICNGGWDCINYTCTSYYEDAGQSLYGVCCPPDGIC